MALASLWDVKQHIGIASTNTDNDAVLSALLDASSAAMETWVGRKFAQATYTEDYNGEERNSLNLKHWPVISVTSLHDDPDRDFNSGTLIDAADYYVDLESGLIELVIDDSDDSYFTAATRNVRVVYVAGYATIPDDVIRACVLWTAALYANRTHIGLMSESIGGYSYTRAKFDDAPEEAQALLKKYRPMRAGG